MCGEIFADKGSVLLDLSGVQQLKESLSSKRKKKQADKGICMEVCCSFKIFRPKYTHVDRN